MIVGGSFRHALWTHSVCALHCPLYLTCLTISPLLLPGSGQLLGYLFTHYLLPFPLPSAFCGVVFFTEFPSHTIHTTHTHPSPLHIPLPVAVHSCPCSAVYSPLYLQFPVDVSVGCCWFATDPRPLDPGLLGHPMLCLFPGWISSGLVHVGTPPRPGLGPCPPWILVPHLVHPPFDFM